LTFNQNNFYPNSNSVCVQGSAGTQAYQPHGVQAEDPTMKQDQTKLSANPGVTGPELAATGGAQNGVGKGLMVQLSVGGEGMNRKADVGVDAALQALAGNTQSTAGQNPTTAKKESTASGAPTTISPSNEHNPALQLTPATALTGQGTAQVTNPTSTLAGASSTPGAVTGGVGTATATTQPAASPTSPTTSTAGELVTTVTANPDGSKTVTTDTGTSYTGKVVGVFPPTGTGTETTAVLLLSDGTPVKLRATGDNALRLGQ
jgi:hypothetical protein